MSSLMFIVKILNTKSPSLSFNCQTERLSWTVAAFYRTVCGTDDLSMSSVSAWSFGVASKCATWNEIVTCSKDVEPDTRCCWQLGTAFVTGYPESVGTFVLFQVVSRRCQGGRIRLTSRWFRNSFRVLGSHRDKQCGLIFQTFWKREVTCSGILDMVDPS
jgi:hypothetical protein